MKPLDVPPHKLLNWIFILQLVSLIAVPTLVLLGIIWLKA